MPATIKDDTKPINIKASNHDIYGVTTIVSLLIPTVGIVLGVVYLSKNTKVDRKLGEHLIAVGILSCIVASIVWFTLFTPRIITPINITTTPASTSAETTIQVTPVWDINAEYAKITKGMTKSSVESEIGKTATNCSESESSASADKYASCTYGGTASDGGIIVVNYVNDLVTTTEKATY